MNEYFVRGRKRKIATSTNAVGDSLEIFSALLQDKTLQERRDWLAEHTVGMYDEIGVLDAYIGLGLGNERCSLVVRDTVPKKGRQVKDLFRV